MSATEVLERARTGTSLAGTLLVGLDLRGAALEGVDLSGAQITRTQLGGAILVGANLANRQIQLLKERYEPGTGTGRHELVHEGEECGMIIAGRLEVIVDGRSMLLRPGDAYYFSSTRPHQFRNPGPEPCELISACTPPSF